MVFTFSMCLRMWTGVISFFLRRRDSVRLQDRGQDRIVGDGKGSEMINRKLVMDNFICKLENLIGDRKP